MLRRRDMAFLARFTFLIHFFASHLRTPRTRTARTNANIFLAVKRREFRHCAKWRPFSLILSREYPTVADADVTDGGRNHFCAAVFCEVVFFEKAPDEVDRVGVGDDFVGVGSESVADVSEDRFFDVDGDLVSEDLQELGQGFLDVGGGAEDECAVVFGTFEDSGAGPGKQSGRKSGVRCRRFWG